jgi:hypothetical protein
MYLHVCLFESSSLFFVIMMEVSSSPRDASAQSLVHLFQSMEFLIHLPHDFTNEILRLSEMVLLSESLFISFFDK